MEYKQRKRTRLSEFDYSSPGAYFVTICTCDRKHYFGEISNSTMHLSAIGQIVTNEIVSVTRYASGVEIVSYVVMPNHIHLLICIKESGTDLSKFRQNVSEFVRKLKACVTRLCRINSLLAKDAKLWQASYNDHIIRGQHDFRNICEYIDTNVLRWDKDKYFE